MQKTDFDTYYIKRQSFISPEKLAGNHNISEASQNISSVTDVLVTPLPMLNWLIFKTTINKSDFDIYHAVTTLKFPKAREEPVYMWRILEY